MSEEQPTLPEHATLADRIAMIEKLETELLGKVAGLVEKGTAISYSDMFVIGAVRRTLAQSKGFRDLITATNFPCAAAILRMQIDTAMRVNALLLVDEPFSFCEALLNGQRFNQLKDSVGEKLSDAYLRKKLVETYPWINAIYEEASDFVHLSTRHFYTAMYSTGIDEIEEIKMFIGGTDPPASDSTYFEVVDAFFAVSRVVVLMLLGYFLARRDDFKKETVESQLRGMEEPGS